MCCLVIVAIVALSYTQATRAVTFCICNKFGKQPGVGNLCKNIFMQVAITPQYNQNIEGHSSLSKDLFIKQGSGYHRIKIDDILFIESDNIYIYLHTANKKYMVRNTINQYLDILNSAQFFKVHRSFAININHVQAIEINHVIINSQHIPIGKTFRNDLLSNLRLG